MKMTRSTGARVACALFLTTLLLGCSTLRDIRGEDRGKRFGRAVCNNLDKVLFLEQFICPQIAKAGDTTDEQNQNALICHHTALGNYHAAMAFCAGLLPPEPAEDEPSSTDSSSTTRLDRPPTPPQETMSSGAGRARSSAQR